jgi:hypothetical protein
MNKLALISLAAALLSTGATAQQYNGFPPPEPLTGNIENTEQLRNFPRRGENGPRTAIERVRMLCASDAQSYQTRCARVKRAMDDRFGAINASSAPNET